MRNTTLLSILFLVLSCSGSGGGGGDGGGNGPNNSKGGGEMSPLSPFERFSKTEDLTKNESVIYTLGCKKAGKPDHALQYDSRLHAGDAYTDITIFTFGEGETKQEAKLTLTSTVKSVSAKQRSTTDVIDEAYGFGGAQAGMTSESTCTIANEKQACQTVPEMNFQPPSTTCFVFPDFGGGSSSKTIAGGIYTFRNGSSVKAHMNLEVEAGDVYCNAQNMGKGEMRMTTIRSNDFPANSAEFCGGAHLASSMDVYLGGNRISSIYGELYR